MAKATFSCPKCNRTLIQSGEVSVSTSSHLLPTFQCDECLKTVNLFGVAHEVALTFAVKDGKPIDHPEPDAPLRF